jgi:hypothetical protein
MPSVATLSVFNLSIVMWNVVGVTYYASAVSYARKMFIKSTPVNEP